MPTDNTPVTATPPADPSLKEDAIYSPSHLDKIRELYIAGTPITLPAQLEEEREALDARRAEFAKSLNTSGSTTASGSTSLPTSSTKAGSTAAPSSASSAGTAGASTAAQS